VFQLPEYRVSFHNLAGFGGTLIDIGYRERYQKQDGRAKRVTRTPFFEIGIPISSSVLTVGYERRNNIDRLNPSNQTVAHDVTAGFRTIFDLADWQFTSSLRYQHNRELFDRVPSANNNRSVQAGLIVEAPKYVSFEGLFRQIGATLFQDAPVVDRATLRPVIGPNGRPLFAVTGPSGFRRPALRVALTFKMFNNANRSVTLSYERNKNLFAQAGQDFLERVMQVTVVWRSQTR
jgi:hypothetical protein